MRSDAETVERLYAEKLVEVAKAAAEIEELARRWEGRNCSSPASSPAWTKT